jgi:hypothetical protein
MKKNTNEWICYVNETGAGGARLGFTKSELGKENLTDASGRSTRWQLYWNDRMVEEFIFYLDKGYYPWQKHEMIAPVFEPYKSGKYSYKFKHSDAYPELVKWMHSRFRDCAYERNGR